MDSVLRPRDIQARIRGGETPEDVAAAAQTSVDKIMGFATPVLAERAYQAELAQRASVRRRTATGPVGHLGQAVEAYLEPHGLTAEDVEWDAWRREDGRWTVLATYLSGAAQETARFTYDTGGRFVVADNDEARSVVGERQAEAAAPLGTADETPDEGPVDDEPLRDTTPEDAGSGDEHSAQLSLGEDTLGMVLGRPVGEPAHRNEPVDQEPELTEDLSPVAAALRPPAPPATADADWMVTQASERPEPPARPAAPVEEPRTEQPAAVVEPDAEPERAATPAAPAAVDEPFEEALFDAPAAPGPSAEPGAARDAEPEPARRQPAKAAKGRGRASVPSWDEIMFGTPKD